MNDNLYKQIIQKSLTGYAYHKMICDEEGNVCDFEVIEVNPAFEKLTGMKALNMIGRKITEVFPDIKESEFDWISFYNNIALNGEKKEIEKKIEVLQRTYKVTIYSPQKNYLITSFIDITKQINELRDSEERFNLMFTNSNANMLQIELETGQILDANYSAVKFYGYTVDELRSMSINQINIMPENGVKEERVKAFNEERNYFIFNHKLKNGTIRPVEVYSSAVNYKEKTILFSIIHDITLRIRANRELKESEEKYRLLVTQMKQGLAVHEIILDESGNAVDYRFLDVNESFERLTGLKHQNIIGKTILEILPETEKYWIEKYGHVAMTGELMQYENYSKELGKYYQTTAYCPKYKQFAVIVTDITQRKEMEISLYNEKKLLEITLISVGDGVISTDNRGNIVFLNKVTEHLTGWTQETARGRSIEEVFNIVNEFTHEKSPNIVGKVLGSKKIQELANHTILISKDGTQRPIEDSAAPIIQEDGQIVGVVLVFRDVTQKRERQKEILNLSYHDQLTGLYNRRFYEEEIKRFDMKRNLPMTIVMGDVNGLKLINDSFGHFMGDELLKKVARVIKLGCRQDDIIARLGGDEFVILLPRTDGDQAEQIINHINDLSLKENVGSINISISFGYETKSNEEEKIKDVLKNAEHNMYKNKLFESPGMRGRAIKVIINTLYEKNKREEQHSRRVSQLCKKTGEALKMPEYKSEELKSVGLLHDIGKIAIDENVLNKPGKLTDDEWKEIKRHPEIGYRILSTVNEMSDMANYILYHHERWDGKGYPKGLKAREIPFMSRIISIADSYDAMTSKRSYRSALTKKAAIEELRKNAGVQFDRELVSIFIEKVLQ